MFYKSFDIIPASSFPLVTLLSPPPMLAAWIQCIWTTSRLPGNTKDTPEKLYPDGGSSLTFAIQNTQIKVHYFHHTHVIRQSWQPSTSYISIRFLPGGARALLGIDLYEFQNIDIDLLTTGFPHQASLSRLVEHLMTLAEEAEQGQAVLRWLTTLSESARPLPAKLPSLLSYAATTLIAPQQLVQQHGLSRRTLERQVRKYVGFSPKQLHRYWQIRQARQRLINDSDSLADIALSCGYFDQAHFTNAFHDHTLETPLAYRQRKKR